MAVLEIVVIFNVIWRLSLVGNKETLNRGEKERYFKIRIEFDKYSGEKHRYINIPSAGCLMTFRTARFFMPRAQRHALSSRWKSGQGKCQDTLVAWMPAYGEIRAQKRIDESTRQRMGRARYQAVTSSESCRVVKRALREGEEGVEPRAYGRRPWKL
ncbi:hypothetical protein EDD64_13348 [Effusibacillus lacus]|nr:hypothetical protein EDD64_13348 [Effusibacillus lacus]